MHCDSLTFGRPLSNDQRQLQEAIGRLLSDAVSAVARIPLGYSEGGR